MRIGVVIVLLSGVLAAAPSRCRAGDNAEPRAIVARAIQAAGGESKLAQYHARSWKERATYFGGSTPERYEATYTAQWPDKFKVEIGHEFTMVLNGDHGWIRTDGNTRDMSRAELDEHLEGRYAVWVMSLLPLGDRAFKLSPLGERKVGDRTTTGVRVSRRGHADVDLYFDLRTGLLARCDTRYKEARTGNQINQECTFDAYRDADGSGVRIPTKASIVRNGKRVVETDVETRSLHKLDDRFFEKP